VSSAQFGPALMPLPLAPSASASAVAVVRLVLGPRKTGPQGCRRSRRAQAQGAGLPPCPIPIRNSDMACGGTAFTSTPGLGSSYLAKE
jgi:hypothetical protein